MIERRTFLGSVVAMCAAGASNVVAPTRVKAARIPVRFDRLNWDCRVIDTISHRSDLRKPVVTGIDVDTTGKRMAVVGDDHFIGIFDFRIDEFAEHLNRHTDWVRAARFSHEGSQLATAGNDRQLFIWDADDLTSPRVNKRNPEAIIGLAFSSDDSKVATVGFESWLRIFDTETGSQISKLRCVCPDNHAVAFSADGELIAAGGRCGTIRIWNVDSGKQVAQYKAHRQRVRSLEFTVDGMLVSGSDDQIVAVTDPENTNAIERLPRLASKLYAVQLLHDGMIATGGSDNRIHLSRLEDGSPVGSLEGHTGTVSCLAVRGDQLVSGSYDTQVRVWSPTVDTSAPLNKNHRHTQLQHGWTNKR